MCRLASYQYHGLRDKYWCAFYICVYVFCLALFEKDVAWAVRMGSYSVTSPNIQSIPFMPTGHVALRLRKDGCHGEDDFTVRPQIFSYNYAHRALVRNHDLPHNSYLECMWWTPNNSDFTCIPNCSYGHLGRCSNATLIYIDNLGALLKMRVSQITSDTSSVKHANLEGMCASMCHAILWLQYHSYTVREMIIGVAYTQRLYLKTWCWLTMSSIVSH